MRLQYTYRTVMTIVGGLGRLRPRRAPLRRRRRGWAAARGARRARQARVAPRGPGAKGQPSPTPPERGCGSPASLLPTSACVSRPPGRTVASPAIISSDYYY